MKRSPLEIRTEILEKSKEPIKPTVLMYACGVNYNMMNKHIAELKMNELIVEIELDETTIKRDKRTTINYQTTPKGVAILGSLKKATKLYSDLLD